MMAFLIAIYPAFFAALPLFGARFIPTHDGEYHIIRFWQFYNILASGTIFPRWAPDLNNGLGIPVFTFNYPFPNYIGSFFHLLGLSFVDSFKWTLAMGYLSAVVWCFLFVKKEFGTKAAVVSTIIFSFVPYWFVDIYVRGSVGEVWALSFVMLALASLVYARPEIFSLAISGLILSHNILAMVFAPIFLISAFHFKKIIYWIVGLGLSSYFWIPALFEQRYIAGLSPVNIFDHFPALYQLLIPSWGSGFRGQISGGNEMSYQIGLVPIFIFSIVFVSFITKRIVLHKTVVTAFILFFIAILFMLPFSMPLWRMVSFVHVIQYPWRLLSIIVITTPILAAVIVKKYRFSWLIIVFTVLVAYRYSRPVTYEPRADSEYLTKESFTKSTSSLGNSFQTKWIRAGAFDRSNISSPTKIAPTRYVYSYVASESGILSVPIAYYPGWKATIDRNSVPIRPDTNGLISLSIPKGTHEVKIWLGSTMVQWLAQGVSILSLSVLALSFILRKQKNI